MLDWIISFFVDAPLGRALEKRLGLKILGVVLAVMLSASVAGLILL